MERRSFLSGLTAVTIVGGMSGCLATGMGASADEDNDSDGTASGAGGDDSQTVGSETPTGGNGTATGGNETATNGMVNAIVETKFERTGTCPARKTGSASVSFGEKAVTVTGCIMGNNGCQKAALADVTYDDSTGTLTVIVTTTDEAETATLCTQQLVYLGYEATVAFESGLPSEVSVVHKTMGERNEAAHTSSA